MTAIWVLTEVTFRGLTLTQRPILTLICLMIFRHRTLPTVEILQIVTLQSGGKLVGALIIGVVLGLLAMFLLAKLVQVSSKLAQNGTLDLRYALGQSATVYLPIPPENQGMGKVTLTLSERFTECDAITDDKEPITVGTTVRVIDLRDGVLVVEKQ